MTSKQSKPSKSTEKKKSPAKKKTSAKKKASATPKTITVKTKDQEKILVQPKSKDLQNFVTAEKFMKVMVDQVAKPALVVRANDIKSLPLRKKVLAWFKSSK